MTPPILYAEDDDNDAMLLKIAFKQASISTPLVIVPDGQTVVDYLSGSGVYAARSKYPLPATLLLDIKMPGMSGLDVLKWVRSRPTYCTMPVVMLTSSAADADVHRAYLLGANGYLVKPTKVDDLVKIAKGINDFWLKLNYPPPAAPED